MYMIIPSWHTYVIIKYSTKTENKLLQSYILNEHFNIGLVLKQNKGRNYVNTCQNNRPID